MWKTPAPRTACVPPGGVSSAPHPRAQICLECVWLSVLRILACGASAAIPVDHEICERSRAADRVQEPSLTKVTSFFMHFFL